MPQLIINYDGSIHYSTRIEKFPKGVDGKCAKCKSLNYPQHCFNSRKHDIGMDRNVEFCCRFNGESQLQYIVATINKFHLYQKITTFAKNELKMNDVR